MVVVALASFLLGRLPGSSITYRAVRNRPASSEQDPPPTLPGGHVTVITPYGSTLYATARLMEAQLPGITADSRRAVLILNMRQHEELGSTFLAMLQAYAEDLRTHEGKLVLAEVGPHLYSQLAHTGRLSTLKPRNVFRRSEAVGASIMAALDAADEWVEAGSSRFLPGEQDPQTADAPHPDNGPAPEGTP